VLHRSNIAATFSTASETGRLRDECLSVKVFFSLADARRKLEIWPSTALKLYRGVDYSVRPSGLGAASETLRR
jgi:hypothetical protein